MSFFKIANNELELRCGEPQASCLGFIYIWYLYVFICIHILYIYVCVYVMFKKRILRDPSDHFGPSCPCPGWLVANWGEDGDRSCCCIM